MRRAYVLAAVLLTIASSHQLAHSECQGPGWATCEELEGPNPGCEGQECDPLILANIQTGEERLVAYKCPTPLTLDKTQGHSIMVRINDVSGFSQWATG